MREMLVAVLEQRGDLFEAPQQALAHGCNCAGAMGRGIAAEFRRRWPDMFTRYRQLCQRGEFNPGDLFVWTTENRVIFNLGTQRTWHDRATPGAVRGAVERMVDYARDHNVEAVAMPRIAAGLGGMEWPHVRAILKEVIPEDLIVTVYSPTS
jgi:O-acetyl-ADP-ribose deacetylase (regulator of RNase III)